MIVSAMRRKCPVCGIPWVTSFMLRWRQNGTITMFLNEDFRAVVMRHSQVTNLVQRLNEKLGTSIEHIVFEAQRNAAKMTFDNTFDGIPGVRLALRSNHVKRTVVEYFNLIAVACGQCNSETLFYEPGKRGIARMQNLFYMPMMAAYVVGAFESLEGFPFDSEWVEAGPDTYEITVDASSAKPEVAERMQLEVTHVLSGCNKLEKCPRCRAPRALADWDYDMEEGTITDMRTGARVFLLDGFGFSAVFRELIAELGEEVQEVLVDVQREWTVEHLGQLGFAASDEALSGEDLEKAYRDYLANMPLDGMGNPVSFEMIGSNIEVTIENPYNVFILAGTLEGLYEALVKTGCEVKWNEPRPGAVHFTVGPKR